MTAPSQTPEAAGLKPCPFCGGEAEIIHLDDGDNAGGSCVCCTKCQASGNVEFGFKENFVENWNRRAHPSPPAADDVVEQYHARKIAEVMDEGDGFWKPCSGCQEGVDGYVSQTDYPFNRVFRCQPGGGCSECGGLGVLWDDTDYDAMATAMLADMKAEEVGSKAWRAATKAWSDDDGKDPKRTVELGEAMMFAAIDLIEALKSGASTGPRRPAQTVAEVREFAEFVHGDQTYGDHPYVAHLDAVAAVLSEWGFGGFELQASAYLHDVIEDADVDHGHLSALVTPGVADIVWACTGEGETRDERMAAIYAKVARNGRAAVVKLADRVANLEASEPGSHHALRYAREHASFSAALKPVVPRACWDRYVTAVSRLLGEVAQ